jgi:cytochrome c553
VVETSKVPKTKIVGGMFVALDGQGEEPLGERIIEVPENAEATQVLRDPRSGFVAYVPVGSIQKGRELAMRNSDSGRCQLCHGADLVGLGPVPGIAGRSPTYLVRQLYDMQHGTRKGAWAGLMTPVTRNLTQSDMLSLAAYIASLKP